MTNVINWFEIPAVDFARAMNFYSAVLNVEMQEMPSPEGKMKYGNFPYKPDGSVVSGGIVDPQWVHYLCIISQLQRLIPFLHY